MEKMNDLVERVLEREGPMLRSPTLKEKRIVLTPSRTDGDGYVVRLEGFYGSTSEGAQEVHDEFLTSTGYSCQRTLRHPINGEWVVHAVEDGVASSGNKEVADLIAYSLAREEGRMIAGKLGYEFENRIKR